MKSLKDMNVLLIEDEPHKSQISIDYLEEITNVIIAGNMFDAERRINSTKINWDIIILDAWIPDHNKKNQDELFFNGWDFYEKNLINSDIPIILWTRFAQALELNWGSNVMLKKLKSFDENELVIAVKKVAKKKNNY